MEPEEKVEIKENPAPPKAATDYEIALIRLEKSPLSKFSLREKDKEKDE